MIAALRDLGLEELTAAAALVSRSMRDNPINVRAFGRETKDREESLRRFFGPVLRGVYQRGSIIGAFVDGALVGVCCMAPPGRCQPSGLEKLSVLPAVVVGNPLGTAARVLSWTSAWSSRDPHEPHWHLGPVAVDPHMQGRGIGGVMLDDFCERMNRQAARSYLETDKSENVRFYEKFGFSVTTQAEVLEVPNWFMQREPANASRNRG